MITMYAYFTQIPLIFTILLVISTQLLFVQLDFRSTQVWETVCTRAAKILQPSHSDQTHLKEKQNTINALHKSKWTKVASERTKINRIDRHSPTNEISRTNLQVRYIEDRPFVEGTLANCLTTNMLVDYGASTSVMSRSVLDDIEKLTRTFVPHQHEYKRVRRSWYPLRRDGNPEIKNWTENILKPFYHRNIRNGNILINTH